MIVKKVVDFDKLIILIQSMGHDTTELEALRERIRQERLVAKQKRSTAGTVIA